MLLFCDVAGHFVAFVVLRQATWNILIELRMNFHALFSSVCMSPIVFTFQLALQKDGLMVCTTSLGITGSRSLSVQPANCTAGATTPILALARPLGS